jgi:hypothetical protein
MQGTGNPGSPIVSRNIAMQQPIQDTGCLTQQGDDLVRH